MKKCLAICIYLLLITAFLRFDIRLLFDVRQFFLVVLGAALLYLPALGVKQKKLNLDRELFGQNSLWASIIQTFVLLFVVLSEGQSREEMMLQTAMACRPLLYGFCLWVVFSADTADMPSKVAKEDREERELIGENTEEEMHELIHEKAEGVEEFINDSTEENFHESVQQKAEGAEKFSGDSAKKETHEPVRPDTEGGEKESARERLANLGLTRREIEVALLAATNLSNAEIASELFISETTVKKHLSNIYGKLGISKRGQIRGMISQNSYIEN